MLARFDYLSLYHVLSAENELVDEVLIPTTVQKITEKLLKTFKLGKKRHKKLQRAADPGSLLDPDLGRK